MRGATVNAARALGLDDRGVVAAGKRADLVILHGAAAVGLVYRWSDARAHAVIAQGRVVAYGAAQHAGHRSIRSR